MVGSGLLLSLTLVWAPRLFPDRVPAPASRLDTVAASSNRCHVRADYAAAPPPTISITIEPAALAPYADAESPVVFPGYLLPDDGCEEAAHAGS